MCSILRESCSKSWRIRVSLDQGPNSAAAASASCEYLLPLRGIFLIKGPSSRHTEGFTERFPFSALVSFLAETHAQKQGGKTSWTTLRLKYLSENCTLYCTHTVPNPSDEPCVPSHGEEAALGISQQPRGGVELQDPGGRKKIKMYISRAFISPIVCRAAPSGVQQEDLVAVHDCLEPVGDGEHGAVAELGADGGLCSRVQVQGD